MRVVQLTIQWGIFGKQQEKAGIDIMEIGVPFSDPIADGPVIQDASFKAIQNGASLEGTFTPSSVGTPQRGVGKC